MSSKPSPHLEVSALGSEECCFQSTPSLWSSFHPSASLCNRVEGLLLVEDDASLNAARVGDLLDPS